MFGKQFMVAGVVLAAAGAAHAQSWGANANGNAQFLSAKQHQVCQVQTKEHALIVACSK